MGVQNGLASEDNKSKGGGWSGSLRIQKWSLQRWLQRDSSFGDQSAWAHVHQGTELVKVPDRQLR